MARSKKINSPVQDQLTVQKAVAVEKTYDPKVAQQSVVVPTDARMNLRPQSPLLFMMANAVDTTPPWGINVAARDVYLRQFYQSEPILGSAVYSASARNASFAWDIVPVDPHTKPSNTIRAAKRMLNNVAMGGGWVQFVIKTCIDLYTQDNGAFWEVIRAADDPRAPVLSLNNLDAARCMRTGDPETPVIYQDWHGKLIPLKYYHVVTIEEMPSPIETMYNAQLCAVSRVLRMAQILKSIFVYKDEKVSGRNPRAIDFVSGVSVKEIDDARKIADEMADNIGFTRFASHILIPGLDPEHAVTTARLDLASLPDNFNFSDEMQWYIAILALGFGVDYQEFAPLTGSSLGSGKQSEVLHLKTQGKGPAIIMSMFEQKLNYSGILPNTVEFKYKDHDAKTAEEEANARFTRGKDRATRLQSGELDAVAARQLAVDDGDIPEWVAADMESRGIEADITTQPPIQPEQAQQTPTQNQKPPQGSTPPNQQQNGVQSTPKQVQGGINSSMKDLESHGGMRNIKPTTDPVPIEDEEIAKQRQALLETLGAMND